MGPTRESRGTKDSSGLATGTNMNMFWVLTNLLLGHTHTHTHTQEESDVIGCMRDPATGMASILDTWNHGPQGFHTPNQLETVCHVDMSHRL